MVEDYRSRNNRKTGGAPAGKRWSKIVIGIALTAFLGCFEPRSEQSDADVQIEADETSTPVDVQAHDDGANVEVNVPGLDLDVDTSGDQPEVSAQTDDVDVQVDEEGTAVETDDPDA